MKSHCLFHNAGIPKRFELGYNRFYGLLVDGWGIPINSANTNFDLSTVSLLIPQCKDGDTGARDQLLNEMQGFLQLVANQNMDAKLRQKIGTSDIVQNSLIKLVERFEQFQGESSIEFRGWLKRIVVNEINSKRRAFLTKKRNTSREITIEAQGTGQFHAHPSDDQLTPSSQAMAQERIDRFHIVLEQLSEDHAQVIRLRNIERLSFKEIGEKMDRSEDAVSKLWYRAILNFEEKFKSSDENDV